MKVFINNHYQGGTATIVVANSAEEAAWFLGSVLATENVKQQITPEEMEELDTSRPGVYILNDDAL